MLPELTCPWVRQEAEIAYHDLEWGVPVSDPRTLFEFLILEGAQAGLSWHSILVRRNGYREAFCDFDPDRIAALTDAQCEEILLNPGVIRNRLKVFGARTNARAWLALSETRDPVEFLWSFIGGRPRVNALTGMGDYVAETPESAAMSKSLKQAGFTFVGSTICYAYMQAVGMVNDHAVTCHRYAT